MSSGDAYTYADSTSVEKRDPIYTSKQWAYMQDTNQGSYGSKQVVFDMSGFYNSGKFMNPQEMYFAIPICTGVSALGPSPSTGSDGFGVQPKITNAAGVITQNLSSFNDNGAQVTSQYGIGYKSGYWNLIQSIQIQVDGKDIIQLTPNINFHASFVANTTWTTEDVKKHGTITGFNPDSADSWKIINDTSTSYGYGVCNNKLPPDNQQPLYPYSQFGSTATTTGLWGGKYQAYSALSSDAPASTTGNRSNRPFYDRMTHTNQYDPTQYVTNLSALRAAANQTGNVYPETVWRDVRSASDSAILGEDRLITEQMTLASDTTAGDVDTVAHGATAGKTALLAHEDSKAASAFRQLQTTCIVRFKDVCDLFQKLPLTRGLYMRVIVNVNTGNLQVSCFGTLANVAADAGPDFGINATSTAPVYASIVNNNFPGTCPIMLAPLVASGLAPSMQSVDNQWPLNQGSVSGAPTQANTSVFTGPIYPDDASICIYPGMAADAGTIKRNGLIVSVSIAKPDPIHPAALNMPSHNLTACRVYTPVIDLEPQIVNDYISNYKNQAVYYKDVLQFVLPNVGPNTTFTYQLANGIVNAKRLIIIPFYHDDNNYIPFEPTSPFSSAPGTVAPQTTLKDFNVMISNMNVFQRNITYSYENFIQEISPCNAIAGGLDVAHTSGMIGYHEWTQNYRYYVVDLSRRLAGDNTPKSLTVMGTNASKWVSDFYMFVEYERHLSLDIESGHINVSSN